MTDCLQASIAFEIGTSACIMTPCAYPRTFGWMLQKPHRLKQPIPYTHPCGAVIWINLPPAVERAVLQASGPRFLIDGTKEHGAIPRPYQVRVVSTIAC